MLNLYGIASNNIQINMINICKKEEVMDYGKGSLEKHAQWKGKIEIKVRAAVDNAEALSLAYTPGVAAPCL